MTCATCPARPCKWPPAPPESVVCVRCNRLTPIARIDALLHEGGEPTCDECCEAMGLVRCPTCRTYYDATDVCERCGHEGPGLPAATARIEALKRPDARTMIFRTVTMFGGSR